MVTVSNSGCTKYKNAHVCTKDKVEFILTSQSPGCNFIPCFSQGEYICYWEQTSVDPSFLVVLCGALGPRFRPAPRALGIAGASALAAAFPLCRAPGPTPPRAPARRLAPGAAPPGA